MNFAHKFLRVLKALLATLVLSTSLNLVLACEPLVSSQNNVIATNWLISNSGGYPSYSNQKEYILVFRNFKSPALCGPDSYYVRKPIFAMGISFVAIMGLLITLRRLRSIEKKA
jgi:hypothetical protein